MLPKHSSAPTSSRRPAIELDQLLDELEDIIAQGQRVPFSGRLLVDEERVYDVIDRLRAAVPEELKQAKRLYAEQQELRATAQARLDQLMAEQGHAQILQEETARRLELAEQDATAIRRGADDYAHQVLIDLQEQLTRIQTSVQNGIGALHRNDQKP